jgi:hypothetical protein
MNTVKTFGSLSCALCNAEKCQIVKALNNNKNDDILNQQSEIFGACKHIPKFHRLLNEQNLKQNLGTDEPPKGRKKTGRSGATGTQTKTKTEKDSNLQDEKENIVCPLVMQNPTVSPMPTNKSDLIFCNCPLSNSNIICGSLESTNRKTKKYYVFPKHFFQI